MSIQKNIFFGFLLGMSTATFAMEVGKTRPDKLYCRSQSVAPAATARHSYKRSESEPLTPKPLFYETYLSPTDESKKTLSGWLTNQKRENERSYRLWLAQLKMPHVPTYSGESHIGYQGELRDKTAPCESKIKEDFENPLHQAMEARLFPNAFFPMTRVEVSKTNPLELLAVFEGEDTAEAKNLFEMNEDAGLKKLETHGVLHEVLPLSHESAGFTFAMKIGAVAKRKTNPRSDAEYAADAQRIATTLTEKLKNNPFSLSFEHHSCFSRHVSDASDEGVYAIQQYWRK